MDEQNRNNIQPNNYNQPEEPTQNVVSPVPPVIPESSAEQPAPQQLTPTFTPPPANMTDMNLGQTPYSAVTPSDPLSAPVSSAMPEPSVPTGPIQDIPTTTVYGSGSVPSNIFMDQKNSNKRKVIVIIGVLLLLSGVAAVLFYLLYWIRSDVVYARYQSNLANVITLTANSETKLTDDVAYTFEGSSESKDTPFVVKGKSRINKGSSNTNIDVALNKATINLSFLTFGEKNVIDSFIKWKGIEQFYNTLKRQEKSSKDWPSSIGSSVKVLKKYDDKWINLDLSSISGSMASSGSGTAPEPITIKDYESLVDVLVPIFNNRYIGLDKNNAVISTSNIKSEAVNGRDCWAYELSFSDKNLNSMIDAMVKAVDSTTLSKNNKKIVKDSLKVYKKPASPEKVNNRTITTYSEAKTTTKNIVWVDKLTGIPIKLSSTSETKYGGDPSSLSTTVFNISELSVEKIAATFENTFRSYTYIPKSFTINSSDEPYTESYLRASFVLDNKNTKNSVDITYDPDVKKSKDLFKGTLALEKPKDNNVISKPTNTVPMRQVIDELSVLR